jgi:lysophospholipase L1-like esterase
VNDLWHKLNGNSNGTVADYESQYHELLKGTLLALPAVRLVILEPFVLVTGAVNEKWFPEFDERRAAAARVAKGLNATFIPLQSMFTQLAKTAPASYWLGDGVHPTIAGHAAIADRWREVVNL